MDDDTSDDELLEIRRETKSRKDRLKAFKDWLNSQGIRETFVSPEDLRGKVESALRSWRDRHPEFAAIAPEIRAAADPTTYLRDLWTATGYIDIRGLAVGSEKAHRFPIEALYVALSTAEAGREGRHGEAAESLSEPGSTPLAGVLSQPRLVVLGDPGAGKTTFLNWVAHTVVGDRLGETEMAAETRLGLSRPLLPVLVRVADWLDHMQRAEAQKSPGRPTMMISPEWLPHYLGAGAQAANQGLDKTWFEERLKAGECLILIDGLDEAPDRLSRARMVRLAEAVGAAYHVAIGDSDHALPKPRNGCPMVVTSRPVAYANRSMLPGFQVVRIAPLGDEGIRNFLGRWSEALFPADAGRAAAHRDGLIAAVMTHSQIHRMARNMVMLTALAVVHWNEKRLPEQRAELYESILTWLGRSREQRPGRETPERCLALLQELALAMQRHPKGRQVQVSRRWAAEQMAGEFGKAKSRRSVERAEAFLEQEEADSGIVVGRGSDIGFWHLTFQEYLAARAIAARLEGEQRELLLVVRRTDFDR
jgi:hypothetical protein